MSGMKRQISHVPPLFASTITISRFGKRCFRDVQYNLAGLLFDALLTVPPCPVICKSGGTWLRTIKHWIYSKHSCIFGRLWVHKKLAALAQKGR